MVHGSIAVPRSAARALPLPWHRVMVSRYGSADGKKDDADVPRDAGAEPVCWLCGRPLGRKREWHHPVPKSRGGRDVVPLHPICHRTIHACFDNARLARIGVGPGCVVARRSPEPVFGVDREQAARFPRPDRTAALREAPR
jgi:hypothetical protein